MPYNDALNSAPKYISQRFAAVNSYVWGALFPGNSLNERLRRLSSAPLRKGELKRLKLIVNEASVLVLIFLLRRFLNSGTEAAISAVDMLKNLGVDGFQVGSKYFSERNEDVMAGQYLASTLIDSLESGDARELVLSANSAGDILKRYIVVINEGE